MKGICVTEMNQSRAQQQPLGKCKSFVSMLLLCGVACCAVLCLPEISPGVHNKTFFLPFTSPGLGYI